MRRTLLGGGGVALVLRPIERPPKSYPNISQSILAHATNHFAIREFYNLLVVFEIEVENVFIRSNVLIK